MSDRFRKRELHPQRVVRSPAFGRCTKFNKITNNNKYSVLMATACGLRIGDESYTTNDDHGESLVTSTVKTITTNPGGGVTVFWVVRL